MKIVDYLRIGRIGIRTTGVSGNTYEIVSYFPNDFYGKMSEYVTDDGEYYYKVGFPNHRVHRDCFLDKETCSTIGKITTNANGDIKLTSVSSRLWDVTSIAWADLQDLLKYFTERYCRIIQES